MKQTLQKTFVKKSHKLFWKLVLNLKNSETEFNKVLQQKFTKKIMKKSLRKNFGRKKSNEKL
jgi:hypothetical protein